MANKPHSTSDGPKQMSYELIKQITDDFDENRILGSGGFGTVYKGVLLDGEEIAVKVFKMPRISDDSQFQKELNLNHQNIVKLVGFCHESEEEPWELLDGKQVTAHRMRTALCLEYLDGGSLEKHISDETTGQNWHTRYKIIRGICEGLKYLHEGLDSPLLHLGLKPSNILLDENMIPKVADFGLSRLFGEENKTGTSFISTRGYYPPEYVNANIISQGFDIFSLGTIIVKIVTGDKGYELIDDMRTEEFVDHDNWRCRLGEISSPRSVERYCKQVKRCIEIGLDCMKWNRLDRPTIGHIVSTLSETEKVILDLGLQIEQEFVRGKGSMMASADSNGAPQADAGSQLSASRRDSDMASKLLNATSLTIRVLQEITNDFSEERKIGQGTYGKVYLAKFENGKDIAVKVLHNTMPGIDDEQFQREFENLMRLDHHNIVRLVGYCYETQHQPMQYMGRTFFAEKTYRALCFEYMQNGSLQKHISDECSGLDWHTRYKIIKGTCEGLKHLHHGFEETIYHLDLKPDNILLDKNMVPKLADFGLSKLSGDQQTMITQTPMGTIGYLPMEFLHGNIVSSKFDIFSLGVIMIKIIGGHEAYSASAEMRHEEFLDIVQANWRNRMQETCHASRPLEAYCQQVNICTQIALTCMEIDRHKRPNIGDIIQQLNDTEAVVDNVI